MGNHEYCTGCGASDFHSGFSCQEAYPKKFKTHQAQKRRQATREKKAIKVASKLIRALRLLGYDARVGTYGGVEISVGSLIK